jgi:hypothetical protein
MTEPMLSAVELALSAVAEPRLFVAGFRIEVGRAVGAVLPFPSGRPGGRVRVMLSPQSLSEADRRTVAAWAADCAERVLPLFEAEAPSDDRPRDGIARARAFSWGELDAAGEIRRRFVAGRAAQVVVSPAAKAAARAAGQAAGVAHMGAHALGAAAYAAKAVALSAISDDVDRLVDAEAAWQIDQLTPAVAKALARLPALGTDGAGPLGAGLLTSVVLGHHIRRLQTAVAWRAGR